MCAAAVVLGLTLARLFFGIDTSDESFYAAIPYRFVLGARPFVDELDLHQTAGILTYPIVRLYVALFSTTGLILALRLAYVVFTLAIGACTVVALRKVVPWRYLVGGALAYIALVPLSLPTLSYNTLAAGFLSLGAALGACYLFVRPRWALLALAGVCHALAAVAYPSLVLAGPVFAAGLWFAIRPRAQPTVAYCAGFLCSLGVFAALILSFGVRNVERAWSFTRSYAMFGGGSEKLHSWFHSAHHFWLSGVPLSVPLVIAVLVLRRQSRWQRICLALLPVSGVTLLASGMHEARAQIFVILFAIFGWLWVATQHCPSHTKSALLSWVFVPSTVAGALTAYTSANGLMTAAVGLTPILLLAGVWLCPPGAREVGRASPAAWTRRLPVAAAIVLGLAFQWTVVYRDASVVHLTARVTRGPYAGLFTTPARRQKLDDMTSDLKAIARPGDHVMFWTGFPAGYLLTSLPSDTPSAWLHMSGDFPRFLQWFRRTGRYPSLIVGSADLASSPPDLGSGRYALVVSRRHDGYAIFRRVNP